MRNYYNNLKKNKQKNNQIIIDKDNSKNINDNNGISQENKNIFSSLPTSNERLNSNTRPKIKNYNKDISSLKYNNANWTKNPFLNKNSIRKNKNYYENINENNYIEIDKYKQENSKTNTYFQNYNNNKKQKNGNNEIGYNNTEEEVKKYLIKATKIKDILNKTVQIIYSRYLKIYFPIFNNNTIKQKLEKNKKNFELLKKLLIINDLKNMKIKFNIYKKKIFNPKNKIELFKKLFIIYKMKKLYLIRKYFYKWKSKLDRKIEIKNIKVAKNIKLLIYLSKGLNNELKDKSFIKIKTAKKKANGIKSKFTSFSDLNDQTCEQKSSDHNTQINEQTKKWKKKKMKMIYVHSRSSVSNDINKINEKKNKSDFFKKIAKVISKIENKNVLFKYFKEWKK